MCVGLLPHTVIYIYIYIFNIKTKTTFYASHTFTSVRTNAQLIDIMRLLLDKNVDTRANLSQVLQHDWLRSSTKAIRDTGQRNGNGESRIALAHGNY